MHESKMVVVPIESARIRVEKNCTRWARRRRTCSARSPRLGNPARAPTKVSAVVRRERDVPRAWLPSGSPRLFDRTSCSSQASALRHERGIDEVNVPIRLLYGLLRITALHRPEGGIAGSRFGCDSIPITVACLYNGAKSTYQLCSGYDETYRVVRARPYQDTPPHSPSAPRVGSHPLYARNARSHSRTPAPHPAA